MNNTFVNGRIKDDSAETDGRHRKSEKFLFFFGKRKRYMGGVSINGSYYI